MVKNVKIIITRDDGKVFKLDGTKYFILGDGLTGLDFPDISVYSEEYAFKDGSTITGSSYSARHIEIKFMSMSVEEEERERVREFFNAKNDFTLDITYKSVTRWIKGVIEGFSLPTENNYRYTLGTVKFLCAGVFFNSYDNNIKHLQEKEPRWGFPFIATQDYSPVMSVFKYGDYVWFDNKGDTDSSFKVFIYAMEQVVNPVIYQGYKGDNVFFRLDDTLQKGDILYIDFETDECYKNGVSSWNLVSPDSKILKIPKAGTYLLSTADEGENALYTIIGYSEKFGGI